MNKVAIIDHVGNKAGMDYYSSSLAKGMLSKSIEPTVYSNFIGIEKGRISYKPYFDGHSKRKALVRLYHLVRATFKASIEAKRCKSKLVIVHLFSADIVTLLLVVIPKLFGLKTAIISHDVSSFSDNDNSVIQGLIYNTFSDYIVVHNYFSYETLLNNVDIKKHEKVKIIKHGGHLDHIGERPDRGKLREKLELEPDKQYILFFGQIKKVKGLDILLEAMSKVPGNINLIIAGKLWKDDFSHYDALIKKYAISDRVVKMIRFIEDDEREMLFFASDVIVLPYRVIFQSGVLLMAMSHGLPVIASDLGPNKEIITHKKNGILFMSENPEDLSKKINTFFDQDSLRGLLSKKSLITIQQHYDWSDIAGKYVEIIKNNS
jgi:D-inositol-3-phosphate glycosyltransferase